MIIIAITGLLLNTMVLLVFALSKKLQITANYFIASLATSGLLLCTLTYPWFAYSLMTHAWVLPEMLCYMPVLTTHISMLQTVVCIAMISYNRYVLLAKTKDIYQRRYSHTRCIILIIISWSISFVIVLPISSTSFALVEYNPAYHTCDFKSSDRILPILELVVLVLCLFLIVRCYLKVRKAILSAFKITV